MKHFVAGLIVALAGVGCTEKAPQSNGPNEIETAIQDVSIEKSSATEGENDSYRFYVVLGTGESATKLDFAATIPGDRKTLKGFTTQAMQCASIECDTAIAEAKAAPLTAQVTCQDETCATSEVTLMGREGGIYRGRKATLSKRVLQDLSVESVKSPKPSEDGEVVAAGMILETQDSDRAARAEMVTVSKSKLRTVKVYVDVFPNAEVAEGETRVVQNQVGVLSKTDPSGVKTQFVYSWQLTEKDGQFETKTRKAERKFELNLDSKSGKLAVKLSCIPNAAIEAATEEHVGALDFVISGEALQDESAALFL